MRNDELQNPALNSSGAMTDRHKGVFGWMRKKNEKKKKKKT